MSANPETHFVKPTTHCPNNVFPVLVYRGVLPEPHDEASTTKLLESHGWTKKGTWGTITAKHFHPNTHECYGVFQGESELIFGAGVGDDASTGVKCHVKAGDVVVVPAGVAHASVDKEDRTKDKSEKYRYIGVYPDGSPKWRNEYGKAPLEGRELLDEIGGVPFPSQDPVTGPEGALLKIWTAVREAGSVA
ncbi:Cupin type-1 domain-containing protein [Fusarium falciforme]|uniref:Cupin type-1 domain-containing protein n=1 Tax=Fusarium falciforme TaxID=195108 RepID=UPI002300F30E|nr:Cupin type-1 domain-containing protein [Fusarium falciforme]WAO85836.1 Cupin type-1 domain-containing protein [Fusarium falciforme]